MFAYIKDIKCEDKNYCSTFCAFFSNTGRKSIMHLFPRFGIFSNQQEIYIIIIETRFLSKTRND